MRTLILGTIFFSTVQVSANTVLLQGPQASRSEYRAMLRADSDLASPSESYVNSHPQLSNRETLLARFTEAQAAFLEKSIPEAQAKFIAVIDLVHTDDWTKSDREVFLHAYFRLAQLESEEAKREVWLGKSTGLGDGLNVDESLFPPPLLQRRAQLLKSGTVISRGSFSSGWTQILINGQSCGATLCGQWSKTAGPVRVTFVSDQWLPQTQVVDITKVQSLRPPMVAWAEGNCQKTRYSKAAEGLNRKRVFWGLDCDKGEVQMQALRLSPAPIPVAKNSLPTMPIKNESKPFYKSGWFWGGVGVVAAFIVIKNSQQKSEKEPTTTYGIRFN